MNEFEPRSSGTGLQMIVLDALGKRIARGEYPAGHILAPDSVGAEFGVSRSVTREAFRGLEARGMIWARHKIGTAVRSARFWNLLDPDVIAWRTDSADGAKQMDELMELRELIEPAIARRAAAELTSESISELEVCCDEMHASVSSADVNLFIAADTRFHRVVRESTTSGVLTQLMKTIDATLAARYSSSHRVFSELTAKSVERHRQIAQAYRRRDADQAATLTLQLVREARTELKHRGGSHHAM